MMQLKQQLLQQLPLSYNEVSIREFRADDITQRYIRWLNDLDVVRFSNQRFKQHNRTSCNEFYNSMQVDNTLFLLIEHQDLGAVGTMTVYFNPHHSTADVGILLGEKRVWGKGIGKTAWNGVINCLKTIPTLRKITAGTLSCNTPMLALINSSNMQPDGVRKQQELVSGQAFDVQHFAIFNSDGC